jgi:hypothetical protein
MVRSLGATLGVAVLLSLAACGSTSDASSSAAASETTAAATPGSGQGRGPGGGGAFGETLTAFAQCLTDAGLTVDTSALAGGGGPGGGGPNGSAPDGSFPDGSFPGGSFPDGSAPGGSFPDGSFPGGSMPTDGAGRGGDQTERIAQMLGLDPEDPTVAAALTQCAPVLQPATGAETPTTTTPT